MITFKPTHKSYIKADTQQLGKSVAMLTCLNTSETVTKTGSNGRKYKELITRFYSMKTAGKVTGHAPRILLDDAYTTVSEATRQRVVAKGSKDKHAYIHGTVSELISDTDDSRHNELIESILSNGGAYIAYDPYRVTDFVIGQKSLRGISDDMLQDLSTMQSRGICKASPVKRAYCFEDGILVEFAA